jgi:phospholipid transport system transporter-binding protein
MNSASIRSGGEGVLLLSGEVVIASVPGLLAQAQKLFAGRSQVVVDLSEVKRVDSSGLALMLEWLQLARAQKILLRFRNIPASLLRIARLSNVEELLPQEAG